jgi:hypothetical protein
MMAILAMTYRQRVLASSPDSTLPFPVGLRMHLRVSTSARRHAQVRATNSGPQKEVEATRGPQWGPSLFLLSGKYPQGDQMEIRWAVNVARMRYVQLI